MEFFSHVVCIVHYSPGWFQLQSLVSAIIVGGCKITGSLFSHVAFIALSSVGGRCSARLEHDKAQGQKMGTQIITGFTLFECSIFFLEDSSTDAATRAVSYPHETHPPFVLIFARLTNGCLGCRGLVKFILCLLRVTNNNMTFISLPSMCKHSHVLRRIRSVRRANS